MHLGAEPEPIRQGDCELVGVKDRGDVAGFQFCREVSSARSMNGHRGPSTFSQSGAGGRSAIARSRSPTGSFGCSDSQLTIGSVRYFSAQKSALEASL